MNVLFLDIDGVLNNADFTYSLGEDWTGNEVDPKNINVLNDVIGESNAYIVITSTWRIIHSMDKIKKILNDAGFRFSIHIIGATPVKRSNDTIRGDEVVLWLKEHPEVESFAILDDDSDLRPFMSRLVQTEWERGLRPEHINLVLAQLAIPYIQTKESAASESI